MKKQQKAFQSSGNVKSNYGQNGQNQTSFSSSQNPQSFHTAGYKGNKPGHDANLGDSMSPSSGSGSASFTSSQSAASGGNQQKQSFHTSSYKGNQPGHDDALQSDSGQPSQGGFSG
ncbi:hypothetical protein [Gorillibacterium massiliense]|uniref:hypothetical protein n=1 Tax=Gorillibacterium massiliense TaxID=1280390 RepID=UPI0004B5ABA8|nr:hypothetical protein [Gorillibacterium massiliense]